MSPFQIYEKLQDGHALHTVLFLSLVSRATFSRFKPCSSGSISFNASSLSRRRAWLFCVASKQAIDHDYVCPVDTHTQVDLKVSCMRSKITSVSRVANVLLMRFVAGNVDVNTPAPKRAQLIGNTAIVRKRRVIHKKSTCVCLRLSVAAANHRELVTPSSWYNHSLRQVMRL